MILFSQHFFLILALFLTQSTCWSIAAEHVTEQSSNKEWHVRLIVSTEDGRQDRGNILGRLRDSVQGLDSHDLPEMPPPPSPMGDRYLSIVFPHPEWKTAMPDFASDFRAVPADKDTDATWKFEIRTHTPGIPAKLSWEGPAEVLKRSQIKEASSGKVLVANCAVQNSSTITLKKEGVVLLWEYQVQKNQKSGIGN
ncbi:MAG: hypothetical protein D3915_14995 [Candidatus Electrothrix sp. AU1_5]|nr:hypothetical protein [Candidatus Electrothrix gigas]